MRYVIKQKVLSLHDRYVIKDERDADIFVVRGKAIEMVRRHSLQDLQGNELMAVRHKPMAMRTTFELLRGDSKFGSVRMEGALKPHFKVELDDGRSLQAKGKIFKYEFTFIEDGRDMAVVTRKVKLKDHFVVETSEHADDVLILSCVIAIESIRELRERQEQDRRRQQVNF